jgi:hypothetical protein
LFGSDEPQLDRAAAVAQLSAKVQTKRDEIRRMTDTSKEIGERRGSNVTLAELGDER